MLVYFENLLGQEYAQIVFYLIPSGKQFYLQSNHFLLNTFVEDVRPILQILTKVLGRDDASVIDKATLGIFSLMMKPKFVLDIPYFWEGVINAKFMNISLIGCFIIPSLITYLFLYAHVENFMHLGLNIMEPNKNKQLVNFWTDVVRGNPKNRGLMIFFSSFLSTAYSIINSSPAPYILPKAQYFLQLGRYMKVGDWYSFKDYFEIRL